MINKIIAICFVLLVIVAGGVYFALYKGNEPMSFVWDGKSAYKISMKSVSVFGSQADDALVSADGYFKTAAPAENGLIPVYAQLKNSKLQSSSGYAIPEDSAVIENSIILINFSKNGTIDSVTLSPEISKETAAAIRNIIYAAETVLPDKPDNEKSWNSLSVNGKETSVLQFSAGKDNRILKARTSVDTPDMKTQINSSEYSAEISRTFWIKNLSGAESLKIDTPLGSPLNVNTTVSYEPIAFDDSILLASFGKTPAELKDSYAVLKGKIFDYTRNAPVEYPVAKEPTPLDTSELAKYFLTMNDNSNDSYFGMVDFLINNPYFFPFVPDIIKAMSADNDNATRMMIGVLEYIGTPEAQYALTKVLSDTEQEELSRVRAAVALNGVKEPTDAAIGALKEQTMIRGNEEDDLVSNTSYLAYGSAASKLMDGGSEKYPELRQQILNDLNSGSDMPKHIVLQGAGNTLDSSMYNDVSQYFTNESADNRFAAISAAGRLDVDRFAQEAEKIVGGEKDSAVRYGVYNVLQNSKTPETVKLMTTNVRTETGSARSPIIKYLTTNVSEPAVEKTLNELTADGELSPAERIAVRKALRNKRSGK